MRRHPGVKITPSCRSRRDYQSRRRRIAARKRAYHRRPFAPSRMLDGVVACSFGRLLRARVNRRSAGHGRSRRRRLWTARIMCHGALPEVLRREEKSLTVFLFCRAEKPASRTAGPHHFLRRTEGCACWSTSVAAEENRDPHRRFAVASRSLTQAPPPDAPDPVIQDRQERTHADHHERRRR